MSSQDADAAVKLMSAGGACVNAPSRGAAEVPTGAAEAAEAQRQHRNGCSKNGIPLGPRVVPFYLFLGGGFP